MKKDVTQDIGQRDIAVIDGQAVVANVTGSWRQVLAAYLAQKDVRSLESKNTYRKALQVFFKWMEDSGRTLSMLSKKDILDFKDEILINRHRTSRTAALYILAIKGFYQWAEAEKLYPNIAKDIKMRIDKGHIKYHLTREQRHDLLEYIKNRKVKDTMCSRTNCRDYAMANLMLRCGLRTIEVKNANINDIRFYNGQRVLFILGKGKLDKTRTVAVLDAAWQPIEEYLNMRHIQSDDEPLFITEGRGNSNHRMSTRMIQYICKEALRGIGLDAHEYSAHSLRHTTGVAILQNGGTLTDVQDVLGHSSIDTSRIYVESLKREERFKNPAERFADNLY